MKIVPWKYIGKYLLSLKKLKALRLAPKPSADYPEGIEHNQFIYLFEGKGTYVFSNGRRLFIKPGMLVYTPQGEILRKEWSRDAYLMFLDFLVEDAETNEPMAFAETTQIIFEQTPTKVVELLEHMGKFFPSAARGTFLRCQKLFFEILYELSIFIPDTWLAKGNNHKLTEAINYIRMHFQENFTVNELARHCGYSVSRLRSAMKAQSGKTPIEYRNQLRIEKACEYLVTTNLSVVEIANKVGFSDVFYFSNFFKKNMGISPSAYRRKSTR